MNHHTQRLLARYPNALEGAAMNTPVVKKDENNRVAGWIDRFIKAETNLERLPFFAPWTKSRSTKLKHTLVRKVKRDDMNMEISWTVSANPEYGYPNAFDLDVYRAVQQVIHDYYKNTVPDDGVISFSFRQIEQRMCQGHSGRLKKDIRNSLERLVATTIKSKGMFFYKESKQYVDDTFHIFDRVTFIGQTMPGGGTAETNYLELSRWYRDSLKAWYVMPLDNAFHFSLRSSNAKALYGILSFYFYARPNGQEWIRRKYSELCEETIITKHPYFSTGYRQLQRALNELIDKQFLAKVSTKPLTENTKGDAWIYFWPGERVLYPERFRISEDQQMLWDDAETPETQPAQLPPPTNNDVASLIREFYAALSGRSTSNRKISKNEKETVQAWVDANGTNCFREFITYAVEQKKSRWPELASLTGALNAYGDEFIRAYEVQIEDKEREDKAEQEAREEAALQPLYRQYFLDRLEWIQENHPQLYTKYEHALNRSEQYQRLKKSVSNGGTHWEQPLYTIEENIAAFDIFSPEKAPAPEFIILDFYTWREQREN
jgi:hypothetical protein